MISSVMRPSHCSSATSEAPLMFQWHDKVYLGAAHGFSGILSTIMLYHKRSPNSFCCDTVNSRNLEPGHWTKIKLFWWRRQWSGCIHWNFHQEITRAGFKPFPSFLSSSHGSCRWCTFPRPPQRMCIVSYPVMFCSIKRNLSLGNSSDRLVQWCHGAPAFSLMWSHAYEVRHRFCLFFGAYYDSALVTNCILHALKRRLMLSGNVAYWLKELDYVMEFQAMGELDFNCISFIYTPDKICIFVSLPLNSW